MQRCVNVHRIEQLFGCDGGVDDGHVIDDLIVQAVLDQGRDI